MRKSTKRVAVVTSIEAARQKREARRLERLLADPVVAAEYWRSMYELLRDSLPHMVANAYATVSAQADAERAAAPPPADTQTAPEERPTYGQPLPPEALVGLESGFQHVTHPVSGESLGWAFIPSKGVA